MTTATAPVKLKPGSQHPLTEEALGYILAHADQPARWIARQLEMKYRDVEPNMTIETWRTKVRYFLGGSGDDHRRELKKAHPEMYAQVMARKTQLKDQLPQLTPAASGMQDLNKLAVARGLAGAQDTLWLVIADLHIPAHKPVAIQTACEYFLKRVKEVKPMRTGVIILGDMLDCYRLSGYPKDNLSAVDFPTEVDYGNSFLDWLQDFVEPDMCVWKLGNHEARLDKYLKGLAPEFYGLAGAPVSYHSLFELGKRGIALVGSDDVLHYKQELFFLHGDETKVSHNPVSPARTMFAKTRSCAVSAHNHVTSNYVGGNLAGKPIACWSVGCLCEMSVSYRPLAALDWNHGFAIFSTVGPKWSIENKRIMDELEVV